MKKIVYITFSVAIVSIAFVYAVSVQSEKKNHVIKVDKVTLNAQLFDAASKGDVAAVKAAIKAGADVDARDEHERIPMMLAVLNAHGNVVEVLLELGSNPNAVDSYQCPSLIKASYKGDSVAVRALLKAGSYINAINKYGESALINAAEYGHKDIVELLLQQPGIDRSLRTKEGHSALDVAKDPAIRALLLESN
ncbi:MAG: ankyrin repeat domain-containing protein [Candidatus Dependentiae bacterium]|nr:ankyrin repeat domain-containing protein [Candidatus Dependentiae bacterium]